MCMLHFRLMESQCMNIQDFVGANVLLFKFRLMIGSDHGKQL